MLAAESIRLNHAAACYDALQKEEESMSSFHDFQVETITGESVSLSQYEGSLCLVVNVATE